MASAFDSIVQTTYNTPLVKLSKIVPDGAAMVLVKLEFFNPLASVKDRIGRAMIEDAENRGVLSGRTHIIEPTSGNTGIALAFVAASRGYRLTLTMPESMSIERRALLKFLGANLVLTPAAEGMRGAINKANELVEAYENSWMPQQFDNPANPLIHEQTTGPEIWNDSGGKVDLIVAGVGTGGTITGVTRFLRTKNPGVRAVAVEPVDSPVISGGKPGLHKIQGIGAGFVPKNLDTSLLNGVELVGNDEAVQTARLLAKEEGIPGGISAGANVAAALRLAAKKENHGKTVVTLIPDFSERYLSTLLFASDQPVAPAKNDAYSV